MKNIPELSCAIVEDLLPTYVERLTSEETNMAVEAHLASCPACAAKRTAMGAKETEAAGQNAEETAREVDYLKKVRRRNRRRVWLAVACTTLVLAGLAVSGMLTAGMNTIKLLYPDAIAGASDFLVGGLSGVTLSGLKGAVLYLITGTLLALLLAADLNVLCLGEQSAASLGLHIGAVRFLGILAAALLAGAAVSFAGLLSFVGLLAPHIARRLVGNNHRILLPAAMLLGAAFVVLCDVLARCLFAPFELPVGILLSLIGGPFFLGLLLHGRGRRMYD